MKTQTNVPTQIHIPSSYVKNTVTISGNSTSYVLPVFQKKDGKKYIRFSSCDIGNFEFEIDKKKQTISIEAYKGKTPLFRLGPIGISQNKHYLSHHDGTPFFYLSDTWWFGGTKRISDRTFSSLVKDRKKKGVTAIQIVVGIPPEVEPFDDWAQNVGGPPFHTDWSINPSYFDAVDARIDMLVSQGIVPVIFGGWGHHIDWMGVEHVKKLWHEIIARYASYPVIFSLCGEVDVFLVPHGISPQTADSAKTKVKKILERLPRPVFDLAVKTKRIGSALLYQKQEKKLLQERIRKWTRVLTYISSHDPYHRIITAHPHRPLGAFELFGNSSHLTLDAIQSGHSLESVSYILQKLKTSKKPVINLEPWYEGIAGNFDAYFQRVAFWYSLLSGAAGHGYGAHGVWQMSDGDNFMRHWGVSDYKTARDYPGLLEIGNAKKFLQDNIDWYTLQPDTTLFSYTAKADTRFVPIASKTHDSVLLYIPDQEKIKSITLSSVLSKKLLIVYDPKTMKKIQTMVLAERVIHLPIIKTSPDVLLVMKGQSV